MENFFDMNKRFKAEPEEIFIDEDVCLVEPEEVAPEEHCFEYECIPTTSSATVPQYRDVPSILDGQFFEIITVNETTCTALCKLCEPRRKTINGSLKATGNFYDHIKRMHTSYMAIAETKRGAKRKPRTKKLSPEILMMDQGSHPATMIYHPQENCSEGEAFNAIFDFVCDTMQPTSIVNTESFRTMVEVLSKNNALKINCPRSHNIESAIYNTIGTIKNDKEVRLKDLAHVCATADFWKQENRMFLGVTAHGICPFLFRRESFALGFRPVKIDDKASIAKEINEILSKYGIQQKVREIVTENIFQSTADDDSNETVDWGGFDQLRSFSGLLKLVISDVTGKARLQKNFFDVPDQQSKKYAKMYDSVMSKLTAFWNYVQSSPRASSFCEQSCGKVFPVPTDEWTSKFKAIKVISETENLHKIFNQVQLSPLEKDDTNFIIEYVTVMQPFATAFDILKDGESFRGVVLPTILSIKCRLEAMTGLNFNEYLRIILLRNLNERFEMLDIMSRKGFPFLIATISHPAFKMSCLPPGLHKSARDVFLGACSALSDKYVPKTVVNTKEDSFFSVLKSPKASVDCIANEALRYLTDDCEDLAMLHRYPCVKNIFLEYNSCLSSSAPVERLFKPCSEVFNVIRPSGISDERFEEYLLIKITNHRVQLL